MREDDIRRPLQGFIVTALETVTFLGRTKHGASLCQEFLRGFDRSVVLFFQDDVDLHDEVGQWVKPGEPGIVHHELQELSRRGNAPINAFIRHLFGNNEGFVQTQQTLSKVFQAMTQAFRKRGWSRPGGTWHVSPISSGPKSKRRGVPTTGICPLRGLFSVLVNTLSDSFGQD